VGWALWVLLLAFGFWFLGVQGDSIPAASFPARKRGIAHPFHKGMAKLTPNVNFHPTAREIG
jgi:hypothetical protein